MDTLLLLFCPRPLRFSLVLFATNNTIPKTPGRHDFYFEMSFKTPKFISLNLSQFENHEKKKYAPWCEAFPIQEC